MAEYQHQHKCDYCNEGVSEQSCHTEVYEDVEYRGHKFCIDWLKRGYAAYDGMVVKARALHRLEHGY